MKFVRFMYADYKIPTRIILNNTNLEVYVPTVLGWFLSAVLGWFVPTLLLRDGYTLLLGYLDNIYCWVGSFQHFSLGTDTHGSLGT